MIPRGWPYGQVASLAGLPGGARRVGRFLSQLPAERVFRGIASSTRPAASHCRPVRANGDSVLCCAPGIAFTRRSHLVGRFGWQPDVALRGKARPKQQQHARHGSTMHNKKRVHPRPSAGTPSIINAFMNDEVHRQSPPFPSTPCALASVRGRLG
jgi:alkylated DNA nucleotide flippase Atl1